MENLDSISLKYLGAFSKSNFFVMLHNPRVNFKTGEDKWKCPLECDGFFWDKRL